MDSKKWLEMLKQKELIRKGNVILDDEMEDLDERYFFRELERRRNGFANACKNGKR